jgi:uncharacterized protein
MKLRVRDIEETAKDLAFEEPNAEINEICGKGPVVDYQVRGPIEVALAHYRAGTDLFFNGKVHCRVAGTCGRCLDEYEFPVDAALSRVFAPGDGEFSEEDDEAEVEHYQGEEVDLSPVVREIVLLALPTQPLCRSDCRGLCPQCGANLNTAACQCSGERGDPRLAVLRSIKLHS